MIKYSLPLRILHWIIGITIIGIIISGFYMTDLPDSDGKFAIYGVHKAIGFIILWFVLARIFVRMKAQVPIYPVNIAKRDIMLGKSVHYAMYALMLIMPISGYLMSYLGGYPINILGFSVPAIVGINKDLGGIFHSVHINFALVFAILIGLHIIGALKHLVIDKVNIIKRIW